MKRLLLLLCLISFFITFSQNIRLNQIGYYPNSSKYATVVDCPASKYHIISETGAIIFKGKLSEESTYEFSGEKVKVADFSKFKEPGTYTISISDFGISYPFEVKSRVHNDALAATIKGFYYQRASMSLDEKYAGKWARKAGHPDTNVIVHHSAATTSVTEGTKISSPKGWYDAGDYGKYIVNSGISCYSMLIAYEHFSEVFKNQNLNIPESDNNIPDLLDEIKYNLDWMLTMQINEPGSEEYGSVYHKLTTKNFEGHILPYKATNQRYVIGRNTEDALNLAAVCAVAARVYKPFDEAYSAKCLSAAKKAWAWAIDHNTGAYTNPSDIKTGEYGNSNIQDSYEWAGIELSLTTGNKQYFNQKPYKLETVSGQWWGNSKALALNSLIFHDQEFFSKEELTTAITKLVDTYESTYSSSPYKTSMGTSGEGDFNWGSNSNAANHGISLIAAYKISGEDKYLKAALGNADYLFGRNAVDYCFLTGHGSKPTMRPHHRPSWDDNIKEPVPGLLAGGPNREQQDNCGGYIGDEPAKSYCDDTCSYASNEIAINWNSPLVYLLAALESYCK